MTERKTVPFSGVVPIDFQPFEKQLFAEGSEVGLSGSGAFNQLVWRVESEGDHSGLDAQIVTLHEWSHHELNNVTIYGGLLTACAQLARFGKENREHYDSVLTDLVTRARDAHEAYATWYSTSMYLSRTSFTEIVSGYSDIYLGYLQKAERLVAEIATPFLRQQAVISAIRICFDSSDLAAAGEKIENLDLSHIDEAEFPNARLERLTELIGPEFFVNVRDRFVEENPEQGLIIAAACEAGVHDDFFPDIEAAVADEATRALLGALHDSLAERFKSAGSDSNPFEYHLTFFEGLIPQINALSDESLVTHPLSTNASPHDNVSNVLLQMESEIVYIRKNPLPATALMFSGVPEERWPQLVAGDPQHLFLCARHPSQILRQHTFSDAQTRQLEEIDAPLTYLRRRALVEGDHCCELIVFDDPDQLARLHAATGDIAAFASLSMSVLTVGSWADQWLQPITDVATGTILFDHSLYHTLKNGWTQFEAIRYAKGVLVSEHQKHVFLTFLCLSKDGTYALFFAPCSELQVRAAFAFIEQKCSPERFVQDDTFMAEIREIVSPVLTHLLNEEHFFSFNDLAYRQ